MTTSVHSRCRTKVIVLTMCLIYVLVLLPPLHSVTAEPISLATLAAGAQLAGTLLSFFQSGADPSKEAILQNREMIKELQKRFDTFGQALEMLAKKIDDLPSEIREDVGESLGVYRTLGVFGVLEALDEHIRIVRDGGVPSTDAKQLWTEYISERSKLFQHRGLSAQHVPHLYIREIRLLRDMQAAPVEIEERRESYRRKILAEMEIMNADEALTGRNISDLLYRTSDLLKKTSRDIFSAADRTSEALIATYGEPTSPRRTPEYVDARSVRDDTVPHYAEFRASLDKLQTLLLLAGYYYDVALNLYILAENLSVELSSRAVLGIYRLRIAQCDADRKAGFATRYYYQMLKNYDKKVSYMGQKDIWREWDQSRRRITDITTLEGLSTIFEMFVLSNSKDMRELIFSSLQEAINRRDSFLESSIVKEAMNNKEAANNSIFIDITDSPNLGTALWDMMKDIQAIIERLSVILCDHIRAEPIPMRDRRIGEPVAKEPESYHGFFPASTIPTYKW